ncbi:hypothetical protein ACMU_00615 [Actibacterium mucosum KCTC 23349]|uniref:Enoyl reductase (ER) domain-containing protein n=1 Tax=Actibacterium mucosum KCTC 23349 TaxID=1454373 RepID=A0A037ZKR4_9RHOB|nr:alcohol dehydrogenase catalytic domain-containing protein [Actibacterium mucosum]KAJ57026.1 hypothetical protein ACMU_00615 [Actibacterium mucosum KCTC 23349]
MKAIRIHGANDVRISEMDQPKPGPGQVLLRVLATGICGTDVEIFDGVMAYFVRGMASYPVTPGHEWVGEVVECGEGVEGLHPGQRAVGECSVGCMACPTCLAGNYHQCPNRTETGILNRDGGFAEYILFPALFLHPISESVDPRAAALVEPTAIAYNGVKNADISPSDRLVIHGDGPIGLLVLQVAKAFGAQSIAMVGGTPARLDLARTLGADVTINALAEDVAAKLAEFGNGRMPNKAIEATGIPQAAATALTAIEPGGTVVLQGLFGGRLLDGFDLDQIVINDLSVKGALGSPGIWPDVIKMIEQGRVDPLAIVSHSLSLDQFEQGIGMVKNHEGIKLVVTQTETAS